jgi:UDP-glucuronate decarboxylase
MHYLVTGGAGFLGSHLCARLHNLGHRVTALDDLSSGNIENIQWMIGRPKFKFIKHDIINPIQLDEIDGIFNLACPASPPFYQKDPIQTMMTCVTGAYNMLQLADKNFCKILQTSTSEVYGDPTVSPQRESYKGNVNCFGPRACYDEGKRAAEALFYDFHHKKNVDIRIVRIFNTYGPQMQANDGRVISNFIVQALDGAPITVYGDGSQTRSFCYVDDMIDGILTVWNSHIKTPVNVGNPAEFTMIEAANKIIKITGSRSKITFHPLPKDDPKQRRPDISVITELGWQPKITLDKGVSSTVEYFQRKLFGVMK